MHTNEPKVVALPRALSRTVSVFSSSAALFDKLRKDKSVRQGSTYQPPKIKTVNEADQRNNNSGVLNRLKSSYSRAYSVKNPGGIPDGYATVTIKKDPVRFYFIPVVHFTISIMILAGHSSTSAYIFIML